MSARTDDLHPAARTAGIALPAAWWRLAAAGAAVALIVVGRGELTLLGAAVVVAVERPWQSVAGATAVVALAVRWGSTDLADLGGAAAALGPAVRVGPPGAALGCALAGAALLVVCAGTGLPGRLAAGAAAALAFVGPVASASAGAAALGAVCLVAVLAAAGLGVPRIGDHRLAGPASLLLAVVALGAAAAW